MSKAADVQPVSVEAVPSAIPDKGSQPEMAPQARQPEEVKPPAFPAAKTAEEFRKMNLPYKEALIDGILYRRDLVAFAGRRRNGKTSMLLQLALSLTTWGSSGFLGYPVGRKRRVLLYLLEDDSRELQDRLNRMLEVMEDAGDTEGRLLIRTKDDFYKNGITIGMGNPKFVEMIEADCEAHKPDLVLFDNLGFLVSADYVESTIIHKYINFKTYLSQKYDCAVITAAHPRKQGNSKDPVTLEKDRDMFFEEVMGSSHFVNSCGSLWGIERTKEGHALFYAGTQRLSGSAQLMAVEMDDEGWFRIADNVEVNLKITIHTGQRWAAWAALPATFTYSEARAATKSIIKSKNAFTPIWKELKRVGLIIPTAGDKEKQDKRFKKASAQEKKEDQKEDQEEVKEFPDDTEVE